MEKIKPIINVDFFIIALVLTLNFFRDSSSFLPTTHTVTAITKNTVALNSNDKLTVHYTVASTSESITNRATKAPQ
jgi:hypothetical protein